ncbi:MAG TPA: glutamate-cysteine ligase family protein [Phycisphaeraceae bacterium]
MCHPSDPADAAPTLGLFEAVGVELEYMIVSRSSLDVAPLCDQLLAAQAGQIVSDVTFTDVAWSNELVLHVIELKTAQPLARLDSASGAFHRHLLHINEMLQPMDAQLMPTAMHPWMDPHRQTQLWPHEAGPIYEAFNRIFDCRGHGWANLQSTHLNLPFKNDQEFARLHAAIRLLLPILPALAASSPIMDSRPTGTLDNRLAVYRTNCARIPSITGQVIPEPVFCPRQYQETILQPIYRDLAPHDPQGTLQEEWVNARGAIARFDRHTIEIRLLDVQECPAADLAIAAAIVAVLQLLTNETWSPLAHQQAADTASLARLLDRTIRDADQALIDDPAYLRLLDVDPASGPLTAGRLWQHLIDQASRHLPHRIDFCSRELEHLLRHGPLARRILAAIGPEPSLPRLRDTYRRLCQYAAANVPFER